MKKSLFLKQSCNELPSNYQFNGIDLFKFAAAILICMIHIQPFSTEAFSIARYLNFGLQQYFCRLAVPFYFAASGFLLFRKTDFNCLDGNTFQLYCFRILRLLGTWTVLLFVGKKSQLWYLGALVVAVVLLYLLLRSRLSLGWIAVITFVLYLIGLLGDSYYGFLRPLKGIPPAQLVISWYEALFTSTRNGFFFGPVFVFMGALFAQKKIILDNWKMLLGLLLSLAAMLAEVFLLKQYSHPRDYNMSFSLLPATFFIFYAASHLDLSNRPIYGRLRIIGMLIFYLHLFFDYFSGVVIETVKNNLGADLSAYQFLMTLVVTVGFSNAIER